MREWLTRLRATLTPQAIALICAAALFLMLAGGGLDEYGSNQDLETRIAKTLSSVEGAGKVSVVLHTKQTEQTDGLHGREIDEALIGAVAVVQGADDPVLRAEIQDALCTLLGLSSASVSVLAGGIIE